MADAENVDFVAESSNNSNAVINLINNDDKEEESETPEVLHQFFDTQVSECETSEEFIQLFIKLKERNRYQSSLVLRRCMDWLVKQRVATDDDRHTILAKKKNETSYNHFYDIIHRIPEDEFERFISRSCFNEGPKKSKIIIIQNTVKMNKANNVGLMASTIF